MLRLTPKIRDGFDAAVYFNRDSSFSQLVSEYLCVCVRTASGELHSKQLCVFCCLCLWPARNSQNMAISIKYVSEKQKGDCCAWANKSIESLCCRGGVWPGSARIDKCELHRRVTGVLDEEEWQSVAFWRNRKSFGMTEKESLYRVFGKKSEIR